MPERPARRMAWLARQGRRSRSPSRGPDPALHDHPGYDPIGLVSIEQVFDTDGMAGSSVGALDRGDRAERLARLRGMAGDMSPLTLAGDRRLPVLPALEPLLPGGGLQRGSTMAVTGSGATALVNALLAGPTTAGSWAAWVGAESVGWAAAAELGVAIERVAVVSVDDGQRPSVLAALVDAFDLVVVGPDHRLGWTERRRIEARARERGAVVLTLHRTRVPQTDHRSLMSENSGGAQQHAGLERHDDGADVRLVCLSGEWSGPGSGWGHLHTRCVTVSVEGRRAFDRHRRWELLLPGPDGTVVRADESVAPSPGGAPDGRDEIACEVLPLLRRRTG